MYKATTLNEQFLTRTSMHSTKGSRRGFDLLNHGDSVLSVLTPEEQRASLVAAAHCLERELLQLPKGDPMRVSLGRQKHVLENRINSIRAKRRGSTHTLDYFIQVARKRLPKALYNAIMDEASELARSQSSGGTEGG
jgi:hypothetical protein